MSYTEFLRVRKAFSIYAAIIAVIVISIIISAHAATVHHGASGVHISINADEARGTPLGAQLSRGKPAIPLGMLLGIAGYVAVVFASVVAASLNRENERAGFVFTKPVSRTRLALSYMAVDLVAIVAAYAYAFIAICLTPLATFGLLWAIYIDANALGIAFVSLGLSFLWYGVLQAVTAGYRGRGGAFVGYSWIAFIGLSAFASVTMFGPIFHGIVMFLNVFNPFAYFSGLAVNSATSEVTIRSLLGLPLEARVALMWCIAAAGCAFAIFSWKRVEV